MLFIQYKPLLTNLNTLDRQPANPELVLLSLEEAMETSLVKVAIAGSQALK